MYKELLKNALKTFYADVFFTAHQKQVHSLCVDSRPGDRLRLIFR